jgi:hypothetical protein
MPDTISAMPLQPQPTGTTPAGNGSIEAAWTSGVPAPVIVVMDEMHDYADDAELKAMLATIAFSSRKSST